MGKSILTIHKEMEKAEHAKTPLGKIEKKIRQLHEKIITTYSPHKPPEELLKAIDEIRTENEKNILEFTNAAAREDQELGAKRAKAVDKMLLESMTKEATMIENYLAKEK